MYIDEKLIKILEPHRGETIDISYAISLIKTIAKEHETEQCDIPIVGRSTCNIEIAIKHFEKRKQDFGNKLSNEEVMKVLYFLKQANEQALDLIGIGYTRYDGGNDKEIGVKNMYEGGFLVKK